MSALNKTIFSIAIAKTDKNKTTVIFSNINQLLLHR